MAMEIPDGCNEKSKQQGVAWRFFRRLFRGTIARVVVIFFSAWFVYFIAFWFPKIIPPDLKMRTDILPGTQVIADTASAETKPAPTISEFGNEPIKIEADELIRYFTRDSESGKTAFSNRRMLVKGNGRGLLYTHHFENNQSVSALTIRGGEVRLSGRIGGDKLNYLEGRMNN